MRKRILVDNCIVTYIKDLFFYKPPKKGNVNLLFEKTALVFLSNIKTFQLEFLLSEESLMEIEKIKPGDKKNKLKAVYYAFKKNKPVIKNRSVSWNDEDTTWDSPDVYQAHALGNNDLAKVKNFLRSKGNDSEFDARYIVYAMLPKNRIDFFLTTDANIWSFRKEIKDKFNVVVMKPSELAEYYKYIR